jgi:hypothetical protein
MEFEGSRGGWSPLRPPRCLPWLSVVSSGSQYTTKLARRTVVPQDFRVTMNPREFCLGSVVLLMPHIPMHC